MSVSYHLGQGQDENWVIADSHFDLDFCGKFEVIMLLGNGYLGIRSAHDENYPDNQRNTFVAGSFDRYANEVTELPNAPDMVATTILLDGERFDLTRGEIIFYQRQLNLRTGLLERHIKWRSQGGKTYQLLFKRCVSLADLNVWAQSIEIIPSEDAVISLEVAIDGQKTNSGTQHFEEGSGRFLDAHTLQYETTTYESRIQFIQQMHLALTLDGETYTNTPQKIGDRRQLKARYQLNVAANQSLCLEKHMVITTSNDVDLYALSDEEKPLAQQHKTDTLTQKITELGFDGIIATSAQAWADWYRQTDIEIKGSALDQLAIRFALYHLRIMTPAHDARIGIGAKGLSGEGYKGHVFWDSEIFILPMLMWAQPELARKQLAYRGLTIDGARRKAFGNGYEGAQFAWESAATGDEETPVWGAIDIVSGKATKIWSGFIEQHITADIAYSIYQYVKITNDQAFLDQYGYEIIFETATFWATRAEKVNGRYELHNVIGPDEYKEHVNNNAFTNHMAHFNVELALHYAQFLKLNKPLLWEKLSNDLQLEGRVAQWQDFVDHLYLPQANEQNLIPQDDTYLSLKSIDLTPYKQQKHVGQLFQDYNLEQVNQMQISKQADVLALLYLLPHRFSREVKQACWDYYEPRTLHDSSLSLSMHTTLACDVNDLALAYTMWQRARDIDFGPKARSSDAGIHTASIGGIWQAVVLGFGGVRMVDGQLQINPRLPKAWTGLRFAIVWQGERLQVQIEEQQLRIERCANASGSLLVSVHGTPHQVSSVLTVSLPEVSS